MDQKKCRTVDVFFLGRVPYEKVHTLQIKLFEARIAQTCPDTLLLLEHHPVITLGNAGKREHVLVSEAERIRQGVHLVLTKRGGDVTVHAPGQLVAYPIFDLKPDFCDVRRYVRSLAKVMCRLASDFTIDAAYLPDLVGIWVDLNSPRRWRYPIVSTSKELGDARIAKLGAIGVRLSRWVTMHGFAFNFSNNLDLFKWIVPCGIKEHGVTSVRAIVGHHELEVEDLAKRALSHFEEEFPWSFRWKNQHEVDSLLANLP